jgi:DNA-binding response OmpR family regulator
VIRADVRPDIALLDPGLPGISGPHTLVFSGRRLTVNGERVYLSPKERQLLELLARHRDRTFSKRDLARHIFADDDFPPKSLDVYITRARRLLHFASGGATFIKTVWDIGYRFGEVDAAD